MGHPTRLWNRYFIFVLLTGLAIAIAMQILNATIALYATSLGASTSFVGMMATLFALSGGLSRLLCGRLSDLYGRRLFMAAGSIVFAASIFGFGAIAILPMLLLTRTLQGMGFASASTASSAAVIDVVPKTRMGEGLGFFSLGTAVSMAAGPMIGLAFAQNGQFLQLYIVTACIMTAGFVLSLMTTYEEKRTLITRKDIQDVSDSQDEPIDEQPARGIWRFIEPNALPASLLFMLFCVAMSCIMTFLPLYARDEGIGSIATFFLVEAAAMFLIRFATSKIYDRKGALIILLPGLVLGVLSCLLLLILKDDALFLIPAALIGASMGICLPVFNALAIKDAPARRWGIASATFMLSVDIGGGLGGALWGVILDLSSKNYSIMFMGAAAFILLSLVLSILIYKRSDPDSRKVSDAKICPQESNTTNGGKA